ncbi:MAG TPA: GerMN domain-containing protein [Pyrinomonadaceae bacterium]|jgi:spore germination protein GerM
MKNSIRKHCLLATAVFLGILAVGLVPPTQAQTGATMKIRLYFPKADPDADNELIAVERTIRRTNRAADAAVRELLKGVNETERQKGLASAYAVDSIVTGRTECAREKMKPLAAYFLGVSIKKGTAIVNFRAEAECYLQSAAFQMARVMNPIDATLKQFPSVKRVEYALDGKIITEWDA